MNTHCKHGHEQCAPSGNVGPRHCMLALPLSRTTRTPSPACCRVAPAPAATCQVDTLPCDMCGSRSTRFERMARPTPHDVAGGAGRVELHACADCGAATRFPRYNDPGRLLEPSCRRGRCGEWANAFLLCCRAAGACGQWGTESWWGWEHVGYVRECGCAFRPHLGV